MQEEILCDIVFIASVGNNQQLGRPFQAVAMTTQSPIDQDDGDKARVMEKREDAGAGIGNIIGNAGRRVGESQR